MVLSEKTKNRIKKTEGFAEKPSGNIFYCFSTRMGTPTIIYLISVKNITIVQF